MLFRLAPRRPTGGVCLWKKWLQSLKLMNTLAAVRLGPISKWRDRRQALNSGITQWSGAALLPGSAASFLPTGPSLFPLVGSPPAREQIHETDTMLVFYTVSCVYCLPDPACVYAYWLYAKPQLISPTWL